MNPQDDQNQHNHSVHAHNVGGSDDSSVTSSAASNNDLAADLIRQKIANLYDHEPAAKEEASEAKAAGSHRSKHQEFMYHLSTSGKPFAQVQTEWHNYYLALPDSEKHAVWQEFYAERNQKAPSHPTAVPAAELPAQPQVSIHSQPAPTRSHRPKSPSGPITFGEMKDELLKRVGGGHSKTKTKHHLQSLLFGVGMGAIVVIILMFGLFNERFIAPFITPSRAVSNTPIIIDPNSTLADPEPKVIIPKINVEIPVVYDLPTIEEQAVQNALERGVVHYATTPKPGEQGNAVIFGHSSNNILNRGKYKFAFVLLNRLEVGDTFVLTKDSVRYVYKIYERRVVKPTEVSVLESTSKPATATLITCDPPGTTTNRLVVIGEQITPDPASNKASTASQAEGQPEIVPGNAPSLWQRLTDWL